jgi:hypothetical protein
MDPNAAADPTTAATTFIQQVIDASHLNNPTTPGTAGGQSFDDPNVLSPDEDKSKLYLQPADQNGVPVFNFALAKVHCISLADANHVQVFFRLRQTQVTYAGYDCDPNHPDAPGWYRRTSNSASEPVPLAGIISGDYVTVPCFAVPRIDSTADSMAHQPTDTDNIRDFTTIGGAEVDHFYGCWIDINQPDHRLPVTVPSANQDGPFSDPNNPPVALKAALARNLHLCLLAEIDYDQTPIPLGKDPSNWDKLAQRNIAWSDAASAQAVTTFEVRPSPALPAGQTPDELMIDWTNTPANRSAQIYLPAVNAADVLAMADRIYTTHRLTRVDDHTLGCATGGLTTYPFPSAAIATMPACCQWIFQRDCPKARCTPSRCAKSPTPRPQRRPHRRRSRPAAPAPPSRHRQKSPGGRSWERFSSPSPCAAKTRYCPPKSVTSRC